MDPENLTYEQKKEIAGKCNFFLVYIFSTAALFCGLSSTGWCDFVARNVQLVDSVESVAIACQQVNMTSQSCNAYLENHAVGYYSWQATIPVDEVVCLSYTQEIPYVGYVTPEFDSKFNAVKAFSIIANIFGAFAFFTLSLASCCPLSQERLKGLSCYFFIATLFQGLTLLIFKSDICSKGFFESYFVNVPDAINLVENVSCSLDRGSKLAISATVLYFFCMNLIPGAVVPEPVPMCSKNQQQEADPQQQEVASADE